MQNDTTTSKRRINGTFGKVIPHPDPNLAEHGFSASIVIRFWARVDKNGPIPFHQPELGPCWNWTGATSHGYGVITRGARNAGNILAHRFSLMLHHGEIPYGLDGLHKCDNPKCVRPDHLWIGPHSENMSDAAQKGRMARGENRPNHLLTELQVKEIRERYVPYKISQNKLDKLYRVSRSTIENVLHRNTWKYCH